MRQFAVSKLNKEAELRKEDLISIKSGKIVFIHDVVARQLKDYVSSIATHRTKQLSGISNMADSEFKKEFLESDEEFKTTILYGFLTKRDVFRTVDDEEYMLGLAKHGGFKMVTMNFDNVIQEELVDDSDELQEYIEKTKKEEDAKYQWSKSVKDVKSFLKTSNVNIDKSQQMKKSKVYMTRFRYGRHSPDKSTGEIEKVITNIKASNQPSSLKSIPKIKPPKGIIYLDQAELDQAMSTLTDANRADFLARLEKVGDSFIFRTITPEQLQLDYQKLLEKLRIEQDKVAKGGAKGESYKNAVIAMQDFKGMLESNERKFANLNVKAYMEGINKLDKDTLRELKRHGAITSEAQLIQQRKENLKALFSKERLKQRGLRITAKGELHKILPKEFSATGLEVSKFGKRRSIPYEKWQTARFDWAKERKILAQERRAKRIQAAKDKRHKQKDTRLRRYLKGRIKTSSQQWQKTNIDKLKGKELINLVNKVKRMEKTEKWNRQLKEIRKDRKLYQTAKDESKKLNKTAWETFKHLKQDRKITNQIMRVEAKIIRESTSAEKSRLERLYQSLERMERREGVRIEKYKADLVRNIKRDIREWYRSRENRGKWWNSQWNRFNIAKKGEKKVWLQAHLPKYPILKPYKSKPMPTIAQFEAKILKSLKADRNRAARKRRAKARRAAKTK